MCWCKGTALINHMLCNADTLLVVNWFACLVMMHFWTSLLFCLFPLFASVSVIALLTLHVSLLKTVWADGKAMAELSAAPRYGASQLHQVFLTVLRSHGGGLILQMWMCMLISLALIGSDADLLCSKWFNSSVKPPSLSVFPVRLCFRRCGFLFVHVCVCECASTLAGFVCWSVCTQYWYCNQSLCYSVNSPDGQISRSNKATNYLLEQMHTRTHTHQPPAGFVDTDKTCICMLAR